MSRVREDWVVDAVERGDVGGGGESEVLVEVAVEGGTTPILSLVLIRMRIRITMLMGLGREEAVRGEEGGLVFGVMVVSFS